MLQAKLSNSNCIFKLLFFFKYTVWSTRAEGGGGGCEWRLGSIFYGGGVDRGVFEGVGGGQGVRVFLRNVGE